MRSVNGRSGTVVSVSASARHGFSKPVVASIRLITGLGVEGDAHAGATTRHRYLVRKDPSRSNRTQVHLLHAELFEELAVGGFSISAGEMGENVTTSGVDLLNLPVGTKLFLGGSAVVEVTGLREPCALLNGLRAGLMKALVSRDERGRKTRKAGIMGIVLAEGEVRAGNAVRVELPPEPWTAMGPV